jgi:HK97 family phage major capsid protein
MPTGLLNAVSVGAIAVGSGPNDGSNPSLTNVVGQQDLVNLVESVDVAYRNAPGAGFILNDSTLSQIKKLTDKEGRPLNLFRSRLENPSGVDTLLGHACYTNPNMPTLQTQASSPQTTIRSVLFGDLSRYRIRRTRLTVQRLVQKWAEYGLVAFLATYRLDGQLVDGSVGIGNGFAVKALTNSF